ncbi:WD40-repeat-containing domain protein [Mycotypha africana]|uniref:WD40-repeat-containing domain protein n=1 Tax=Mycotypha africana TaxID=64632 RepID=UPI00230183A1|nr:WD40-repeat-containing domain protein [Mycotypha africana]KAI8984557.1 WD40-repeat-containing domain protein [Mycotypha africana]
MPSDKDAEERQQKIINRDFNQWRKNAHLLYDMAIIRPLTWPSLTCQWLPQIKVEDGFIKQELILGTHTSDEETEYLEIHSFNVPEKQIHPNHHKPNLSPLKKIRHEGEVNRARYQPHNPDIIATKTRTGEVLVFDRTIKQEYIDESYVKPILRLKGHALEGYGLAWNPQRTKKHHLISAGFEGLICHWDVSQQPENSRNELEPLQTYHGHKCPVNDVSWNSVHDSIFASVADDKQLMIWDIRDPAKPRQTVKAHQDEIQSVAYHPKRDWMLATGSSDKSVGLFDMRKLNTKLYSLESHNGHVTQVAWSPHDEPIIASAGADRKIIIWDLRNIGQEQSAEDAEDGPPELMFVHAGHTNRISEFSWNPLENWTIASTADDNVVQIWRMSKKLYASTDQLEISPNQLE